MVKGRVVGNNAASRVLHREQKVLPYSAIRNRVLKEPYLHFPYCKVSSILIQYVRACVVLATYYIYTNAFFVLILIRFHFSFYHAHLPTNMHGMGLGIS